VRYFGVFAASAGIRAKVLLKPTERRRRSCAAGPMQRDTALDEEAMPRGLRDELGFNPLALAPPPMPARARRLDWASLVQRVFDRQTNCWSHC
jgi:hypothetical protein